MGPSGLWNSKWACALVVSNDGATRADGPLSLGAGNPQHSCPLWSELTHTAPVRDDHSCWIVRGLDCLAPTLILPRAPAGLPWLLPSLLGSL